MRRWYSPTHLPSFIGAAAILVPSLLLLANWVLAVAAPEQKIAFGIKLDGVYAPVEPDPSLAKLLSGDFQSKYAKTIAAQTPVYEAAVLVKNQLYWSLFGNSGAPTVYVGRGRQLMETSYVQEYCSRDLTAFGQQAAAWLPHLHAMQDDVEKRGQTFLYVITPSKVAQYPVILPPGLDCPSTPPARAGVGPLWRHMLDQAGIHYLDTAALVAAAHPAYNFPLFARGGTHWNMVGAALATQAVAAALDARRGDETFAPFDFTWQLTHDPMYPDDDLTRLMNLIWPDHRFEVPLVTLHPRPAGGVCHSTSVAIVGGSFMHQIAELLNQTACHPHFDMWEYWRVLHLTWPYVGQSYVVSPVDPAVRARNILGADIVIYEENEQLLANSRHGPAFYDFLQAQR